VEKGFGLSTPDDGRVHVFVYFKRISGDAHRNLDESAGVEYDLTQAQKWAQAPNVGPV
jgi:cold shock protein